MPDIKDQLRREKLIAILRMKDADCAYDAAHAIAHAGIRFIEITLNTASALAIITTIAAELPDCFIGAGTILDGNDAEKAAAAGAKFLVSPIISEEMIEAGKHTSAITVAGALTPNEIYRAHMLGTDFIKPFPLAGIGAQYIRALKGPFPDIEFIPTNGVTLDNIRDFLEAGVTAVGLGSALVKDGMELAEIERRARQAVEIIHP